MAPDRQFCGTHNASLTIRCIVAVLWGMSMSASLVACSRGIGDACETALNCSASATRLCDRTQKGGYCTLSGCQAESCPTEAACVSFWQNTQRTAEDRNRLSVNYCMRKCDERSDCRDDDGYACLSGSDFGYNGEATVLGHPEQRFCALRLSVPPPPPPISSPDTDSGANPTAESAGSGQ